MPHKGRSPADGANRTVNLCFVGVPRLGICLVTAMNGIVVPVFLGVSVVVVCNVNADFDVQTKRGRELRK